MGREVAVSGGNGGKRGGGVKIGIFWEIILTDLGGRGGSRS